MKIDDLIEQVKKQGMPEVAAVLAFTRDKGTDATIALLATVDRHANAGWSRRRRLTQEPFDEAVAGIKDRLGAQDGDDERPWLDVYDARQYALARPSGGEAFDTAQEPVPCSVCGNSYGFAKPPGGSFICLGCSKAGWSPRL